MLNPVVKVNNLSKRYRIGDGEKGYKTFREVIMEGISAPIRPSTLSAIFLAKGIFTCCSGSNPRFLALFATVYVAATLRSISLK